MIIEQFIEQFDVKLCKNLTTRVPNSTQSYFPYKTVTSACQGCACTQTVTIFRTLMKCTCRSVFVTKTNHFTLESE